MQFSNIPRFLDTVRYLQGRQLAWRLYYRLMRGQVRRRAMAPLGEARLRRWQAPWSASTWMAPCLENGKVWAFLGERGEVRSARDWNGPHKSKLWLYNLHYFDDLNAREAGNRFLAHYDFVERWIADNPPLEGNGWEPYPLSLRLVNLIKWLTAPCWQDDGAREIPSHWVVSLARQAQALSAQREYHILANHLFANGKALTFAGALLDGADGERWLRQGLAILDAEIPEQFLDDGGHFERSPMYHATLLWDLCDLIHLAQCSGLVSLCERESQWRVTLEKGLAWLTIMTHPDGGISFFNDAAFGIAPMLADLQGYAEQLAVSVPEQWDEPLALQQARLGTALHVDHAEASGYVAVNWGAESKAILDLAPVGPDYQPGHAHADTLSMELSLFGQRLLVNSGTSRYGNDSQRQWQRSTASHNTVAVDDADSSEVWAGFRVARRARPYLERLDANERQISIVAHHTGYESLPGRNRHQRTWEAQGRSLAVRDIITGHHGQAMARWYFHPDVRCQWRGDALAVRLPAGEMVEILVEGAKAKSLEEATWNFEFGNTRPNCCLVVTFTQGNLITRITW